MESKLYACVWADPSRGSYFDMEVPNRSVKGAVRQFEKLYAKQPHERSSRIVGVAFHYSLSSEIKFKGRKVTLRGGVGSSGGFARRSYLGAKLLTWFQAAKHDQEFAEEMKQRRIKYAILLPFSVGMYAMRMFAVKNARVYKGYVTAKRIHGLEARPWYVLHPKK